jgi:hypothetical protein
MAGAGFPGGQTAISCPAGITFSSTLVAAKARTITRGSPVLSTRPSLSANLPNDLPDSEDLRQCSPRLRVATR